MSGDGRQQRVRLVVHPLEGIQLLMREHHRFEHLALRQLPAREISPVPLPTLPKR